MVTRTPPHIFAKHCAIERLVRAQHTAPSPPKPHSFRVLARAAPASCPTLRISRQSSFAFFHGSLLLSHLGPAIAHSVTPTTRLSPELSAQGLPPKSLLELTHTRTKPVDTRGALASKSFITGTFRIILQDIPCRHLGVTALIGYWDTLSARTHFLCLCYSGFFSWPLCATPSWFLRKCTRKVLYSLNNPGKQTTTF